MTRWADSHCHPHLDERLGAPSIERARQHGVEWFMCVGTDFEHSQAALDLAGGDDSGTVLASVGLHPHDATNGVGTVRALFDDPRCRAVGECGLDYYYDHSPHDVQREAFAQQIAIANERDLPLIVHSRDAWDDTFAVLDANGVPKHTIFHCFTGGPAEARLAIDRGAYLSFSGIVSFKAADDLRAAAAMCPADRLLVETDSPYLAPVPHRGQMNEPAYLPDVGAALAAARNAEVEHVAELTLQNFLTVFGVSDGAS